MPEIQDINEFKNDLIRLGNEPEIREQRGEALPNITVPESQSVDDLSALFDDDVSEELNALDESALFDDDFSLPEGLTDGLSDDLSDGLSDGLSDDLSDDLSEGTNEEADFDSSIVPDEEDPFSDIEEFDFPETSAEFSEENDSLDEDALPEVEEPAEDFNPADFSFDEVDEATEVDETPVEETDEISEDIDSFDFDLEEEDSELADFSDVDMFDTSELDESGFEADDSVENFENAESDDSDDEFSLEDFSLGEIDGDDIEASEFSLGDLGEEFGVDEVDSNIGQLEDLGDVPDELGEDFGDAYSDDTYAIPDDEFIDLKKTLGQLPRNLKLIIEELIGEKNLTGDNLDKLVQALIRGAGAKEIGSIVSRITGKKVRIPAQYERRTAEEFEKEKGTFGYIFKKNFIPMFRAAAIAAVILGLFIFIGYRFVYTPLHAESLYKKGYEEISRGNNQQANSYFDEAFSEWQKKKWFYNYAESFIENKQYILAEEKYEQLLSWYPDERDAILDYAHLEFKILGKYPEAERLLSDLLFDKLKDYDARLMLADTYMEWAQEIDSSKYDEARFNYAKLMEQYGTRDELLFRMLRYFIRTDNHKEAMIIYEAFKQNKKASIEPEAYSELAGYLIDKQQLADVREILIQAEAVDDSIPEIHYHLARYFDIIDIPYEEEKALNAAIWLFEDASPLTRTRNGMLIDSYNRYGKVLFEQERYLDAEDYYQKAALNYEESLAAGQIEPEPKYGSIFSNLGDLAYYISGDYDQALMYFKKAEENQFSPPILKYKKGYIYYSNEEFRDALVEFYDTAEGFSVDRALMYSTANALFNRNDYFLAEGYYTHLLDILNKDQSSINYLLIDEIPEHRALLENLIKVSNNLGVTKYRLYERSRDPEKNAEAMVLLTDSVEYYDRLSRDPELLIEPDTVNLSYLNSKAVFYPVPDYRLQIYQNIPKDLDKIRY